MVICESSISLSSRYKYETVIDVDLFFPETLKFSPPPVSKKLELGSSAKIHCKAQGTPPPIVHWQKEGSNELPSHITDTNGTLHFNSVIAEDKGKYICTASNSQGMINITITLDVVGKPDLHVAINYF